ncbi:MAG: hypothetical protein JO192_04020 [Candidatus Eremiobacteraeota bacterium]|nr:hypothetical protein [Candidatus Eremiobacteraeota bacterium]
MKKAADNVQATAGRARNVGETLVGAGEMIKETADAIDSFARRAKNRIKEAPRRTRS